MGAPNSSAKPALCIVVQHPDAIASRKEVDASLLASISSPRSVDDKRNFDSYTDTELDISLLVSTIGRANCPCELFPVGLRQ